MNKKPKSEIFLFSGRTKRKQLFLTKLLCLILLIVLNLSGSLTANSQQVTVTGRVTDASGESLPGVSVVIEGTTTGTVTDVEGKFSLVVPNENAVIVFSFVGYSTSRIPLEGRSVLEITLTTDAIDLDEIVVVGYGTQRRATLTGSVVGVRDEEITRSPTGNLSNTLAGLLPGLISTQRSGTPGADASSFLVRGNTTTGDNTPLILVDGVPETGWQNINPNDVESISVLKDAAAAIYGVQAANGVILITTKRGLAGKPTFDLSINQAITQPTRVPEMASSATLAEYGNEWLVRTGRDPLWSAEEIQKFRDGTDPVNYPNTNWIDYTFKNFTLQEVINLNIRGGADNMRYRISGSYSHQDDILKDGTHSYKGYTLRSNIDSDVTENITLSLDVNAGLDDRNSPLLGGVGRIYTQNPQYPVYWPGGYPSNPPSDYGYHPMINNTGGSGYDDQMGRRFSGRASYDINIPWIEGLGTDGYFFYRNSYDARKRWLTPWTYYSYNKETGEVIPLQGGTVAQPQLTQDFSNSTGNLFHLKLRYTRQFTDHYLNTFVAYEESSGFDNSMMAFRRDYVSPAIDELFAGAVANMNTSGTSSRSARKNLFGRVSYNFQEKYLIDFNFRYDGSYRFPRENRWGFFPGVSAAWRISEENFMRGIGNLDDLKLRVSYGQIGNDAIDPFQYMQSYNLMTSGYHFGDPRSPRPGVFAGVSPNPNITWEVSTIANVGFDALFANHLVGLAVDIFQQRRTNILTTRALAVPEYTGLVFPMENIGIVDNKGIELSLNHRNTVSIGNGLSYYMSGNFAFARSNVVDVAEPADVPDYQKSEGAILGAGLYYEAIGIFRTQAEIDSEPVMSGTQVGDLKYRDYNGDGRIDHGDRIRMNKSIIPEITFGYNLSAQYNRFSLFAHFAGQARAWWYIHQNARVSLNAPAELLENRYTPGSMDSKYPILPQDSSPDKGEVSGMPSDFWLQNASFLRLKTLELSYSLPQGFTSRYNIDNARIYVSGNNLFTWSEIKWYDPEGENITGAFYPQMKIFNLGVQLIF
jgi:TonB-dependent starch-binding outer membrane protein SusC